jgi:hypothetical protein
MKRRISDMKRLLIALATGTLLTFAPLNSTWVHAQELSNFPLGAGIELSAAQQQELRTLQQSLHSDIMAVLTPAQQEQLTTIWTEAQDFSRAIAALNLTPEQRQALVNVFRNAYLESGEFLTPAQQQQLRTNLRNLVQQL